MTRLATILFALLLTPVAGCATEVGPVAETRLELGTGSWRFEPLQDGAPVELVAGAQGGHHVWISIRSEGLEVETIPLRIETQLADESRSPQVTDLDSIFLAPPDAEGMRSYLGWPHILSDAGCLVGQMLRIEVSTTTPDGTQLVAERDVMVQGGEFPPVCLD